MRALCALASFLVSIAFSTQAETLRLAVISDLNGSYGSTDYSSDVDLAVARIIELNPDLVISTGDMVAGQRRDPHLSEDEVEAMWTAFHDHVTLPLAAVGIPLLVTPGNHDASDYVGFTRERQAYDRTWTEHAPTVSILDGERYPFRYAVSQDGVLLISLDVTTVGPLPPEELDWLEQLLREESQRHRATVLFSHLPLWPVAQGRENEVIGDPALGEILSRAGVDLYLSGHHHAYYPGVADGVLFVAQACLGGGPRKLMGTEVRTEKAFSIVEIDDDGKIIEFALRAPDFTTPIALETLPRSIGSGAHRLVRRDLVSGG